MGLRYFVVIIYVYSLDTEPLKSSTTLNILPKNDWLPALRDQASTSPCPTLHLDICQHHHFSSPISLSHDIKYPALATIL
jgi:hypothetical protein